jgi:hypothetical protein
MRSVASQVSSNDVDAVKMNIHERRHQVEMPMLIVPRVWKPDILMDLRIFTIGNRGYM